MKFQLSQKEDIWRMISERKGETKIGEHILAGSDFMNTSIEESSARYVLIGIPEDIGPRANMGKGGADTAWEAFLTKFLNIQETDQLNGKNILLLGDFNFDRSEDYYTKDIKKLRDTVALLDKEVSSIIERVVALGKIPIVIGGGHNNAYGLLKGCSMALQKEINCINLDPHADYRALEGRHSGNGFSYAKKEGFLGQYSIVALHENYNSQAMLKQMKDEGVSFTSFEDIFLRQKIDFRTAIEKALGQVNSSTFGVELDCDSIQSFPSSAQTPSGISANEARCYIHQAASNKQACYLHLPEAAPSLVKGSEEQVGKLLAYLVSDFIKAHDEACQQ